MIWISVQQAEHMQTGNINDFQTNRIYIFYLYIFCLFIVDVPPLQYDGC